LDPRTREAAPARLVSLDTYRGLVMVLLVSGGFGLRDVAAKFPGSPFWQQVHRQLTHLPWSGCALWDLIQPAFIFMAGVAIPYSYAARRARGESDRAILRHTALRSLLLILLGLFLVSTKSEGGTNWVFTNVLIEIGLGLLLVSRLRGRPPRMQAAVMAALCALHWGLFVAYPAPPPDFDRRAFNVPEGFETFTGLWAHWNLNTNVAAAFDRWFLNLFPRKTPYVGADGWQTLNIIMNTVTMTMGLMAGELLRGPLDARAKLRRLVAAAVGSGALGAILGQTLCPMVRHVETPAFVFFAAGWVLGMLALLFWAVDVRGWRRWTFPLVVAGMNSTALYCMRQLDVTGWIRKSFAIHFGAGLYRGLLGSVGYAMVGLAGAWLICFWMYRRKIFLRL
jgi:heparan-alpha-glucosaminide N-acetyltransferase